MASKSSASAERKYYKNPSIVFCLKTHDLTAYMF